jgi:hypothetical protein
LVQFYTSQKTFAANNSNTNNNFTMMLAVAARRIASRTAVVLPSILRAAPSSALQLFSTEAKIPKEPQWGIGKLKTSTGLVRMIWMGFLFFIIHLF